MPASLLPHVPHEHPRGTKRECRRGDNGVQDTGNIIAVQTRAITRYKSRYDSLSSLVIAEVRNIWGFGLFDIPAGVNFTRRTQLICAQVSLVVLGQIFTLRI